ncbi:amino acid permease 8 isoform X3 [Vigna radiata var. radiata]|nr:amino acid permease 8 isoform X3 [Vigna radiata var. radiata]XP_022636600.1 amino acid permease 8 isoform X3 [Vigna radiata var. radiata]
MQAVKAYLGGRMYVLCGLVQYTKLAGITVGYTITSSTSLVAIRKAICFHNTGKAASCKFSNNPFMIGFGILQIFLSQIPNFNELTWLSTAAAITSFGYVFIGSGLCLSVVLSGKGAATSITGTKLPVEDKLLKVFTAMGNIGLACTYATVIYDIMDTLKSHPAENKQMKRANVLGVTAMTILFLLCSGLGYAAFGDNTPGNILTGFTDPFWLVALGNGCIVMHMIGAYQVMGQPFFRIVEMGANMVWPDSDFINKEYSFMMGNVMVRFNLFRLVWRTIFVIFATVLAMVMPFFSEVLSLLGAIGFGPLVVFFPIQMHIAQKQIRKLSLRWYSLQFLSCLGFIISVTAVIGSIHGIIQDFHKTNLSMYKQ